MILARYTDRCAALGRLARMVHLLVAEPEVLDAWRSTSRVIEDG